MDQTQRNETNADFTETIQNILRICKKGRWLIALTALLTAVGANVGLRFIPNKYRSEATILVAEDKFSSYIVTPLSTTPLIERVQLAAREVLSQPRLLRIVDEFDLRGDDTSTDGAVESLRKNIDIEPAPPYSAFQISFTARTPQLARNVTQRLVDLFIERHLELEANQAETASSLIQQQLAERRRKLSELEQRTRVFNGQSTGQPPDVRQENLEEWRQTRYRIDTVTANRDRAIEQRATLESSFVGNLNARLTRLKDERTALLKRFTAKHPEVVSKDQEIAQLETEIAAVKAGGTTLHSGQTPPASADPVITQLQGQLEANTVEIDNLSREIARQTAIAEDYRHRLNANPIYEQQSSTLMRETQALNDEISDLEKRQQQSGLAADMGKRQQAQQFRLVDPPSLPTHPASKRRKTANLAADVIGPLLGLVLAFLLDFRKPTFHNENELRRKFAPPLVLSIPTLPTSTERRARAWRTAFELLAGSVVAILVAATEFYSYRLFS